MNVPFISKCVQLLKTSMTCLSIQVTPYILVSLIVKVTLVGNLVIHIHTNAFFHVLNESSNHEDEVKVYRDIRKKTCELYLSQ